MGYLKELIFIVIITALMSCGVNLDPILKSPVRSITDLESSIDIRVPDIHGGEVLLGGGTSRPTVILFAQDTCDVCGKETEMILSHLDRDKELLINIVTILIGTTLDDALWWEEIFGVSWKVGLDQKGAYFKQYCPENTVPCIVIYDPIKGVVLRHHGELHFEQIQYYTGPWF